MATRHSTPATPSLTPGGPATAAPDGHTGPDAAASARWTALQHAVATALDLPPAERAAFLAEACGADAALLADAERLLGACERAAAEGGHTGGSAAAAAARVVTDAAAREAARAAALRASLLAALRGALAGRYDVEREIGRGGMATVFLARDERHGRPVAIKVVHTEAAPPDAAERFRREIAIAARLQHPQIVPLHDSGTAAGLPYYVMPYVAGESLRAALARDGALAVPDAVRLLREVADALDYAHAQGVVHRDVKPENVLLSHGHALVADFGIAAALAAAGAPDPRLTATGAAPGTPAYMAPEQAAGAPADHRADLYALGVVAYEMLAGGHPFPGRSLYDLVTAHATRAPDALARRRPGVPPALEALVMHLLAKRPDERPASAAEVVAALDRVAAGAGPAPRWRRLGRRLTAGRLPAWRALAAAAALAAAGYAVARRGDALDPNRVLVFPLTTNGAGLQPGVGEDVATLIGYALEGAEPLRWLEARDYVAAERADSLPADARRALSRRQHAAFYIDGSVVRDGDSTTVVLRLHSVAGDSVVARRGAAGPTAGTPVTALGLRATSELLVPLLAPGRRVDVSALSERRPAAVASFLQGEREYRQSHPAGALAHYQAALAHDSLLAPAALNGALAANWLDRPDVALPMTRLALAQVRTLPAYRAAMVRGLHHFFVGAADSALAEFERARALEPARSDPWMALGELYRHLLPDRVGLDSLAEDAFARARQLDTASALPLYHLAELAMQRGALARADTLVRGYSRAHPDSALDRPLRLALACARRGAPAPEWTREAGAAPPVALLEAGVLLAGRGAYVACARQAFAAALGAPGASEAERWGALLALHGTLAVAGRDDEAARLFRARAGGARNAERLLLLAAAADGGPAVRRQAAEVARAYGERYDTLGAYTLWVLGEWEGSQGRPARVPAISAVLARKADSSRTRRDALLAQTMAARAALAAGDTALAVRRLRALTPSAPRKELLWYPWEGLGGERLLLARLLLARGDLDGAERAAARLDGAQPVVYLLYLRPSLTLRQRVAEARGDARAAAELRARLTRLAGDTAAPP